MGENTWTIESAGSYYSSGKKISLDPHFQLYVRKRKLKDALRDHPSAHTDATVSIKEKTDLASTVGSYFSQKTPIQANALTETTHPDRINLPAIGRFEYFKSLMALRSNRESLMIGIDSEWAFRGDVRRDNDMISWQAAVIHEEDLIEFVWLRVGKKSLSLEMLIGRILDYIGREPEFEKERYEHRRSVTIICHAGKADLTTFDRKSKQCKDFLKSCTDVQGGVVTLKSIYMEPRSLMDLRSNRNKVHPIKLNIADTMCHAPTKKRSLRDLGEIVNYPKLVLPAKRITTGEDIIYKQNMDLLLEDDKDLFLDYAGTDAVIALLYASAIYGYNKVMRPTITSAAADVMQKNMMAYLDISSTEEFDRVYRGLTKIGHGLIKPEGKPGFIAASSMEPMDNNGFMIHHFASQAFHGGFNGSFKIGYYPEQTHDYDLKNAYPTAMCLVPDIDWENPIRITISQRWLSLNDWRALGSVYNPFLPFFGFVRFEFPEDVAYPTIPINVDGVPIFPLKSDTIRGVYTSGVEIYLALRLGAKVWCETGYVLNTLMNEKTWEESYSLRAAVYQIVKDRSLAIDMFGKNALEEMIQKEMVNAGYGKNAQNVIQKSHWSVHDNCMKSIGCSKITNPVSACMTTSIVRALLLAALNQATELGYDNYSATTDGFISNIPLDVLSSLDLYGLAPFIHFARSYLTDGKSELFWEEKHTQNDLLNFTTRGNVSLEPGGVCAHNGCVSGYPEDSYEDRKWLAQQVLTRTGRVSSITQEWLPFKDLVAGKSFSIVTVKKHISMDYDLKRKPVRESIHDVTCTIDGKDYLIANVDTKPFTSVEEYEYFRQKKRTVSCLRDYSDWKTFWNKVDAGKSGAKPRDIDWAVLNSCVMGHRTGKWRIPALENGTVKEKLVWLNQHNDSERPYKEDDWKHAREKKRAETILPMNMLEKKLEELDTVFLV